MFSEHGTSLFIYFALTQQILNIGWVEAQALHYDVGFLSTLYLVFALRIKSNSLTWPGLRPARTWRLLSSQTSWWPPSTCSLPFRHTLKKRSWSPAPRVSISPDWLFTCWPHLFIPESAQMSSLLRDLPLPPHATWPSPDLPAPFSFLQSSHYPVWHSNCLAPPVPFISRNSTATSRKSEISSVSFPHFVPRPQRSDWHMKDTGNSDAVKQLYLV